MRISTYTLTKALIEQYKLSPKRAYRIAYAYQYSDINRMDSTIPETYILCQVDKVKHVPSIMPSQYKMMLDMYISVLEYSVYK